MNVDNGNVGLVNIPDQVTECDGYRTWRSTCLKKSL